MMPWNRCRAVATTGKGVRRCDRRRYHTGPHASYHGFDEYTWIELDVPPKCLCLYEQAIGPIEKINPECPWHKHMLEAEL